MRRSLLVAFSLPLLVLATTANAQTNDRAEQWRDNCERGWNNDRARFCEVRTYTVSPARRISVDAGPNGGVAFIGENRRDVRIVARVQATADDDAAAVGPTHAKPSLDRPTPAAKAASAATAMV